MPNMKLIQLKTMELLRCKCGCQGNQATIATTLVAKGPFIYKVTGGPGEFMGGHLKNFSLLGGVKGKKLDANGGGAK